MPENQPINDLIDILEAQRELMAMTREELDRVPYAQVKWVCRCKGCTNGSTSRLRDYGISPYFYFTTGKDRGAWYSLLEWWWTCGKHNTIFRKLRKKGYSDAHIYQRFLDRQGKGLDEMQVLKPMETGVTFIEKIDPHAKKTTRPDR